MAIDGQTPNSGLRPGEDGYVEDIHTTIHSSNPLTASFEEAEQLPVTPATLMAELTKLRKELAATQQKGRGGTSKKANNKTNATDAGNTPFRRPHGRSPRVPRTNFSSLLAKTQSAGGRGRQPKRVETEPSQRFKDARDYIRHRQRERAAYSDTASTPTMPDEVSNQSFSQYTNTTVSSRSQAAHTITPIPV
jgi:hypothetical protein